VPSEDFPGQYPVGLSSHWWKGCLGGVCCGIGEKVSEKVKGHTTHRE
jgi:hypothetical protein